MTNLIFDFATRQSVVAGDEDGLSARRFQSRSVVWLTLALWLANYATALFGSFVSADTKFAAVAVARAGLLLVGLFLCLVIHTILQRIGHWSFARRVCVVLILSIAAAELYAWSNYFGMSIVAPERLGNSIKWGVAIANVASWTWFFLAWAGLRLALEYDWDAKEEQRRAAALQELAQAAKLEALHRQINPHFLFNSLNSIAALIANDESSGADQMVGKLADFFRMTLATNPEADIPLSKEIELQVAYLEIEQLRFPDLELDISLPAELHEALVPALLLQPLVENAVKYGVASSEPPARINLTCAEQEENLIIHVEDRGRADPSMVKPGAGIGLRNVRARLHERFGEVASLTTSRTSQGGFKVSIKMPLIPS